MTNQAGKEKGGRETYPVLPLRDIWSFRTDCAVFAAAEVDQCVEGSCARQAILLAPQEARRRRSLARCHFQMERLPVLQLLKCCGTREVLRRGTARAKVVRYVDNADYSRRSRARCEAVVPRTRSRPWPALPFPIRELRQANKKISPEVLGTIGQIEDYSKWPTPSPRTWPSRRRQAGSAEVTTLSTGWSASTR